MHGSRGNGGGSHFGGGSAQGGAAVPSVHASRRNGGGSHFSGASAQGGAAAPSVHASRGNGGGGSYVGGGSAQGGASPRDHSSQGSGRRSSGRGQRDGSRGPIVRDFEGEGGFDDDGDDEGRAHGMRFETHGARTGTVLSESVSGGGSEVGGEVGYAGKGGSENGMWAMCYTPISFGICGLCAVWLDTLTVLMVIVAGRRSHHSRSIHSLERAGGRRKGRGGSYGGSRAGSRRGSVHDGGRGNESVPYKKGGVAGWLDSVSEARGEEQWAPVR